MLEIGDGSDVRHGPHAPVRRDGDGSEHGRLPSRHELVRIRPAGRVLPCRLGVPARRAGNRGDGGATDRRHIGRRRRVVRGARIAIVAGGREDGDAVGLQRGEARVLVGRLRDPRVAAEAHADGRHAGQRGRIVDGRHQVRLGAAGRRDEHDGRPGRDRVGHLRIERDLAAPAIVGRGHAVGQVHVAEARVGVVALRQAIGLAEHVQVGLGDVVERGGIDDGDRLAAAVQPRGNVVVRAQVGGREGAVDAVAPDAEQVDRGADLRGRARLRTRDRAGDDTRLHAVDGGLVQRDRVVHHRAVGLPVVEGHAVLLQQAGVHVAIQLVVDAVGRRARLFQRQRRVRDPHANARDLRDLAVGQQLVLVGLERLERQGRREDLLQRLSRRARRGLVARGRHRRRVVRTVLGDHDVAHAHAVLRDVGRTGLPGRGGGEIVEADPVLDRHVGQQFLGRVAHGAGERHDGVLAELRRGQHRGAIARQVVDTHAVADVAHATDGVGRGDDHAAGGHVARGREGASRQRRVERRRMPGLDLGAALGRRLRQQAVGHGGEVVGPRHQVAAAVRELPEQRELAALQVHALEGLLVLAQGRLNGWAGAATTAAPATRSQPRRQQAGEGHLVDPHRSLSRFFVCSAARIIANARAGGPARACLSPTGFPRAPRCRARDGRCRRGSG